MSSETDRLGILFILSSPSGAGKSTLSKLLLQEIAFEKSISATTRAPRGQEQDGCDYIFLNKSEFKEKIQQDKFLEWAEVHGNYYGTFKESVLSSVEQGKDVLFDIDYNGMLQIKRQLPSHVVSVFILPPSMEKLAGRLANRQEDSAEEIRNRLNNAYNEINQYYHYDYVLVNNLIEETFEDLLHIYKAETLKRSRNLYIKGLVKKLCAEKCLS